MLTTVLWLSLLFLSRVFAGLQVSDVYSSQSQCDTAVDLFKNEKGETPCTLVLALLVPCNVNVSESSTFEINASACACNVAFYNLLSACAMFCVRSSGVDPFYRWSESCMQVVPMTREYPFAAVITAVIPSWASEQLSSGGNFDPSVVMRKEWTTLQKLTPVIVGLGILILVGLVWCFYRTYKRPRYSRRAQGMQLGATNLFARRRNGSAASYSSTSHLNPDQLSLPPVHRIRFFFSGMLPVRERPRNSDWNIEGEPGLPRTSPVVYGEPSRRESDSFFTPEPSLHAQDDTPPSSSAKAWPPLRAISRWWTSTNLSKGGDYQAVHLLSGRKNSKFGVDDDDHPDPAFGSLLPQNQASNTRNGRTSGEEVSPVVVISNGERGPVSRSQTPQPPQPETEQPNTERLPSLRPNRPGRIVAIADQPPSQPLSPANGPTTTTLLTSFPTPPGVRQQASSDTFHTSRTTLSMDPDSDQTAKPKKKLSPELLFPPSVIAAGYSVPQRPADPVLRAWIPRVNGTSSGPANSASTEPPSYDQAHTAALSRPLSPTSTHPYPYTNHLRSTSDVTALGVSPSPRPQLQGIDTQNEPTLNRLSLAVNEPTSPLPTATEDWSGDGYTDFTPITIVHESDTLQNLEHTPYPSSTMLPLSAAGTARGGHPPPARR